ncbi:hypothetical protein [Paenibacillus illinoisensis]|uniref:hypothetical protein n=1 Tax=Paenibacillus illinoisensis TaxID=59845 RepID=UPI003D976F32
MNVRFCFENQAYMPWSSHLSDLTRSSKASLSQDGSVENKDARIIVNEDMKGYSYLKHEKGLRRNA